MQDKKAKVERYRVFAWGNIENRFMKSLLLLTAVLLISSNSISQSLEWAKSTSGTNNQVIYGTAVDQSGNVYNTGEFWGTTDFDPSAGTFNLSSQGGADIFVQKYDANGNLLWAIGLGAGGEDIGTAIDLDQNGNAYITGAFRGTIDFDPGAGSTPLTTGGYSDIFVLKLDANGAFVWAKNFQSFVDFSTGNDIKVDDVGNVYTTGKMKGSVDFDPGPLTNTIVAPGSDIFIHKLTANGDLDWVRTFGGSGQWVEEGQALEIDDQGDLYISGIFMSTVDFDAGLGTSNLTAAGTYPNVFLLKLQPNASFVWAKGFGSTSNLFPSGDDIAINGNDLFLIGKYTGTVDFDPGVGVVNITGEGSGDLYIEKFDTSGGFQWVKTIGNSSIGAGISIATDYFSNVYATGTFSGTMDFDPAVGTTNEIIAEGNLDAFVLKLDENGDFDWAFPLGGNGLDQGNSIISDQFGTSIWTSGSFSGMVDFDPTGVTANISSVGLSDGFVQKINQVVSCIPTFNQLTPSVCTGASYVSPSGNYSWNQTGSYTDTLMNSNNCDSIITIDLTVLSPITGQTSVSICDGENYQSPSGNYTWNMTGTYLDTVPSTASCDSVITIDLTVLSPITGQTSVTICDGEDYSSPSGNYTWDMAGIYMDTVPSAASCDSVITIDLSVTSIDTTVNQQSNVLMANQTGASYQWIDCDDNNIPISGETNALFTATTNGNYALEITFQNCTFTTTCYEVDIIGLNELYNSNVKAYPNPTSGEMTIELPKASEELTVKVLNVQGQLVNTLILVDKMSIELPAEIGLYFLYLSYDGQQEVIRVIKE
jgi:hypothetical protein